MSESEIDLGKYKQRLEALREQTRDLAVQVDGSAQAVELDQNRVGRLSRMDAMQGQAIAQASAQRQQLLLQKIEQALERIGCGDFGRCIECDEMIARARLDIDLVAEFCIQCAEKMERK